ncbi:MAG: hypothetical protein RI911_806 [Candidatus Parcubacteria bacterium]|jgi:drug/metabolite transporter (DMT)-like permease
MEFISLFLVVVYIVSMVVNKIFTKVLVMRIDAVGVVFWTNILGALVLAPLVFAYLSQGLNLFQWFLILLGGSAWAIVGVISNISAQKADVSLREPLLALRIPLVAILSIFFLEESLTFGQVIATTCILFGIILTTYERKLWTNDRNTMLWLLVSIGASSVVVLIDKIAATEIPVSVYVFYMFLVPALLQGFQYRNRAALWVKELMIEKILISVLTGSVLLSYWTNIALFARLPLSVVYPILQCSSIVTVIIAMYYLQERRNMFMRVVGVVIASAGVVLFQFS